MNENKEDETLKTIQNMYKKFNIIYATYAKMSNENEVIAICIVRGFEIRDKKTTDLLSTNTWLTLNQLDIRGQKIILNFSKEPIEFLTANSQTLFEAICDVLQRVLLPNELEKLNFSRFNAYPVLPTPYSIRKRFSMMKRESDIDQYDESETKFDDLLKIGSDVLDLSNFPKLTKLILEILPMFNFIKYLIIPKIDGFPIYQQLDAVLPNCRFLRHIKLSNKADSHFSRFLTTIINSTSNISSLSFGPGSSLTIENLKLIRSTIVNSRIHSLELNNSLENSVDELGSNFYSLFDGQLGTQLWSLNMNETMKINFDILLPKLRFITSLSFANCGIEINKFFEVLCESGMQNLTYLNLDKNDCAEKIPETLKFPSSLTHISVNDVSWKKNSLVSFFNFFMKQKDEIHLSIARAKSYEDQWDSLFEFLESKSSSKCTNFQTFIWDHNQVRDSLINFLKKNKKLSYLSMSGCFSNNESSDKKSRILSMFEYIKEAPSLKTLVIEGTDEYFLGEKFPVIIDACLLHPSLSVLDLAYSRCGNVGIAYLIPLVKRGKLNVQVLNIEGAYLQEQDENVCIKLFKELTESASDVFVSFPQKENEQIFEHKLLKQKQKFQLLFRSKNTLLSNVENENEIGNNKYTYKKFVNTPFYLYPLNHYSPEILFPFFFEEPEHKRLNFLASKRIKAAQKRQEFGKNENNEEEEERKSESDFIFANENGEMKFSEVPQRAILRTIVKEMNTPKSPNDIEASSMFSSETESQIIQKKIKKYDKSNNDNEDSSNSVPISPSKTKQNPNKYIEKVPESKKNKTSPKNNNDNNENNDYMLSEFNKREIISFKEKYKINKSAITFPKLKNPNQIMDEKWNKIDEKYSLESLYEILKSQRNSVPK